MDWTDDRQETYDDFRDLVNMTPSELGDWLDTDASKRVGDSDSGESTGHRSGRRILDINDKTKDELTQSDLDHMSKVVGYIKRHRAQGPDGSAKETDWRYSLKNWGHDPCKDDSVDCS